MNAERLEFHTKEDWLAARASYITSTDMGALFGVSPYQTPFELYLAKRGSSDRQFTESERMRWGLDLEHVIATRAAERHGLTDLQPAGWSLYVQPDHKIAASIDFVALDSAGNYVIIECKNVDGLQFLNNWEADGDILVSAPAHIEIQVQTQVRCSGCCVLLAALVGGNRLVTGWRDQISAIQRQITERVAEFWRRDTAPDPVYPDDTSAVLELFSHAEPGKLLDAKGDADLGYMVREYKRIAGEAKDMEELRDTLKAQILQRISDAERVMGDGYKISAGIVAPSQPTVITADMVGQTYGGRAGYRAMKITLGKPAK